MKKVIYTILVGKYDDLLQPLAVDESFDYICFSNDFSEKTIGIWNIRKIPFSDADNTRVSRYAKLLPHKVLQEYEYSLYIDANIQITGSEFYRFVNQRILEDVLVAQVPNIFRDCIYKDIEIAYRRRKVNLRGAMRQYRHLKQEGFPEHFGLFENNVLLRKHNDQRVVELSEAWWKEYCDYTHRDQFSLMYVYWKKNYKPGNLLGEGKNARNVTFLKLTPHPKEKTFWLRTEKMLEMNDKFHSFIRKFIWSLFGKR
jgi:hypothetical protein